MVARVLNPGPQGYLWSDPSEVAFLQWTEDDTHHLNGTLQSVDATSDGTVSCTTAAFTGVHDGSNVSITFSELGFSSTLTGSLDGGTLTLQVPQPDGTLASEAFRSASVDDYDSAATALRHRTQSQAAATHSAQATASAQGQLDQGVTDANTTLSNALGTLSSDVQNLTNSTSFGDA